MPTLGVVIVAHGDRSGAEPNAALAGHARALADTGRFAHVGHGVLKGEPGFEDALVAAAARSTALVVVPMLMAEGYFTASVLPRRLAATGLVARIAAPLGLNDAIPGLIGAMARESARAAGLAPGDSDLMVVGHGSALGDRARVPVERACARLDGVAGFVRVRPAYVEEDPFLGPAVDALDRPTVVASLLASDGLHGSDDLDEALAGARVPIVRTGALGRDQRIRPILLDLIAAAASGADRAVS